MGRVAHGFTADDTEGGSQKELQETVDTPGSGVQKMMFESRGALVGLA